MIVNDCWLEDVLINRSTKDPQLLLGYVEECGSELTHNQSFVEYELTIPIRLGVKLNSREHRILQEILGKSVEIPIDPVIILSK